MGYSLGVDLGNTYVAAAVSRGGDAEMATLGQGAQVIPAAVFVGEDGAVVVGEPAVRRGLVDPDRLALGFKRRIGHPAPAFVGGAAYSPQQLLAELLRSVVGTVVREWGGEQPERIVLSRPATWDPSRRALFEQVPGIAGLRGAATTTEPEAVITHYATSRRLAEDALVAVYDLGGGTFEVSVVRARASGVELVGQPQGIDRLGGIDFDEALIDLVDHSLGGPISRLDPSSAQSLRAMARLREQCVYAKEVLSHDDVVDIPVQLDRGDLEARVTRDDLEHLLRPHIEATVPVVHAALRSAGLSDAQLDSILLVGGSSRIPLVARTLREAFSCPVRANVNPDNAVALGAALTAAASKTGVAASAGGPASAGTVGDGDPATGGPRPPTGPRNPTGPRSAPGPVPPSGSPQARPVPQAPSPMPPVPTPPIADPSVPRPPTATPPRPAQPSPPPVPSPASAIPRPPAAAPPTAPSAPTAPRPPAVPTPVPPAAPAATTSPAAAPTPAAAPALFVPSPPSGSVAAARPAPVAPLPSALPEPQEPVRPQRRQRDPQTVVEVRRVATLVTLLLLLAAAGAVLFVVLLGIRITL